MPDPALDPNHCPSPRYSRPLKTTTVAGTVALLCRLAVAANTRLAHMAAADARQGRRDAQWRERRSAARSRDDHDVEAIDRRAVKLARLSSPNTSSPGPNRKQIPSGHKPQKKPLPFCSGACKYLPYPVRCMYRAQSGIGCPPYNLQPTPTSYPEHKAYNTLERACFSQPAGQPCLASPLYMSLSGLLSPLQNITLALHMQRCRVREKWSETIGTLPCRFHHLVIRCLRIRLCRCSSIHAIHNDHLDAYLQVQVARTVFHVRNTISNINLLFRIPRV